MANIFLDADELFTLADDASVFGRGGGNEGVVIQDGVTGINLGGNVERVDVAASAADTTLQVNADGQLEVEIGGNVVATVTAGLQQDVDLRFSDGNVTLSQETGTSFQVIDPNDENNTETIDTNTAQTGDSVNLGGDTSDSGNLDNVAPTISDQNFTVAENASDGTSVGTVTALDTDGTVEAFAITGGNDPDGNGTDALAIDDSGQLTVANAGELTDGTDDPLTLTVEATDDDGATASASVTVDIDAPGPTTQTVDGSTSGALDASGGEFVFEVQSGNFTQEIENFEQGDELDFFDTPDVQNTDSGDGVISVQATNSQTGDVAEVELTGLDSSVDGSVFNTSTFNQQFGADALM